MYIKSKPTHENKPMIIRNSSISENSNRPKTHVIRETK